MNDQPIHIKNSDFIELLQGNKIQLENGQYLESLNEISFSKTVILYNLIIEEDITIIESSNFPYPILIENCIIRFLKINGGNFNDLDFINTTINRIIITKGNFSKFSISEGTYNGITIHGGKFFRFQILGGVFNYTFSINDAEFLKDFKIENGCFNTTLFFKKNSFKKLFLISGGEFNSKIIFGACTSIYFEIYNGVFNDEIRFYKLNEIDEVWITGGSYNTYFKVIGGTYGHFSIFNGYFNSFNITGGEFNKDLNLYGGTFEVVRITNGTFKSILIKNESIYCDKTIIDKLLIKTNNPITLTVDSIILDRLSLNYILRRESTILFQNIKPRKIVFKNFTNNGKIIFNHVTPDTEYHKYTLNKIIKRLSDDSPQLFFLKEGETIENIKLEIETLIKNKKLSKELNTSAIEDIKHIVILLRLYKKLKKELIIHNSFLGDTEFRGVKFRSFENIFSINSNLSNIKQHRDFLPSLREIKKSQLQESEFLTDKRDKKTKWDLRKDFYRDLVTAANNQQDIQRKINYFASYQNSILYTSGSDYSVKFSIWFNKVSNDYGRSWILSLVVTIFALGLIPFCLYMYSMNYRLSFTKSDIVNTLGHYSEFLLPTHKNDFLGTGKEINGWSKIFDFMGRIFVSLGIYQTIQAFRKIGRSPN